MENIWFLFLVYSFMACCFLEVATPSLTNLTTDQSALLALKAHINFEPHNIFLANNWSTNTFCCNWIGVTCGIRHKRVTSLNLVDMGLNGTIPPHLGNLSFLASLDLGNNSFRGHIPKNLAFLHRLKFINLGFNEFNGVIPSWFDLLPSLKSLLLSNSSFSGTFPPSLCNMSKLEHLYISGNQLHGYIPKEIGGLTMLKNLSLYDNHFSGLIPSSIYNMSSLQNMYLGLNSLTGSLPIDMCNHLPELELLNIKDNELYGQIPSGIHKCRRLQYIILSYNNITGSIPREIGNLTMLKHLYLDYNNFRGAIPEELGNLHNLEIIQLESTGLSGSIPSKIFNISTLEVISLSLNSLSGQLPPSIGLHLHNLKGLYVGANKLTGVIPSSISNASQLTVLELGFNSFTGVMPDTLGNLKFLNWLSVQSNSLTTESSTPEIRFLTSLTNCKYLTTLAIRNNPFNGILPVSIANFSTSLNYFNAGKCGIRGGIPREIGNLTDLVLLVLGGNELTGRIPPTIGKIQNLQVLFLSNNKLQGFIPDDLCFLRLLFNLDSSGNELSGPIPACIGNLTSLRELNLNSNKFNSTIPSGLWSLANILKLNLSSNSLSGSLPLDIGSLKTMTSLDLSRNQLSGNVPTTIKSLQSIATLSLAYNRVQGLIPESFGDLLSLESLDLSHNNFSGSIPKSLEKLKYLKKFNVSFNRLWGEIPNAGPFANFSAQSFMMNAELCGAPRLQVLPCKTSTPRGSRKTVELLLKYVLPAIVITLLAILIVLIRCRKMKVKISTQADLLLQEWRRISYHELLRATNGFNESNLLGTGSYGTVYKGILSDGVIVAAKVFNLQLEGAFKSFDVECEVLRNIRHRNLIKIISSCSNDLDFRALVFEYMPNESLEKWLYSHNYYLDIMQRLNIMIDVALALEYLHHGYSTPIVHCDLKPNNILLDGDMVAHVGDFGISKLLGEGEFMKQTMTLATIGYMAPEYGAEGIVSTRGDVYSYGIMLMEMFTRKKPTDEVFAEEMNLKRWVSDSLHGSITEVVDSNLLGREDENFLAKEQCVLAALERALECTPDIPDDRINMEDVVVGLVKIKNTFLAHIGGPDVLG